MADSGAEPTAGIIHRVARATTAPVRNYVNEHFERVKDEVRALPAQMLAGAAGSDASAWQRLAELENLLAEQSVHQARSLAQLSDAVADLSERIGDLERVVRQLSLVVAPPITDD